MKLQYPNMRKELRDSLEDLADRSRLLSEDENGSLLDYAVHFLFDDTNLCDDASNSVGWFLHSEMEAQQLAAVCDAFNVMFARHGTEEPDAFYLCCDEWEAVDLAVKRALRLLHAAEL